MILLFEHPLSPYAQKCKIALREKGVPFEARLPAGIGAGTTLDAAFAAASPRGEVPALVDGDVRVFDSTVILEYLEDRYPAPALLPASPAERARVRMLEDAMDTHVEAINWGLAEIHFFRRATGDLARDMTARAGAQLARWHAWLERALGDRTWFNGEAFGWGDLSVVPYLNGSRGFGFAPPAGSRLAAWLDRANARESVAATVRDAATGVAGAGMTDVAGLVAKGLFKREYRDHRLEWMVRTGGLEIVVDGIAKGNVRFVEEFR